MIEFHPDVRRFLAAESAERRAVAYRSSPGGVRRRIGRLLLVVGARLTAEPARPPAPDLHRAGDTPGAWRSARAA